MFTKEICKYRVLRVVNVDDNHLKYYYRYSVQKAYTVFGKEYWSEVDWHYTESLAIKNMEELYEYTITIQNDIPKVIAELP